MSKKGFSIDDLINPKPRKYQPETSSAPRYPKTQIGQLEARRALKALRIETPPIPLNVVCEYYCARIIEVDVIGGNPRVAGRHVGDGTIEIRRGLHKHLYRSTLAHELGHLALEHDVRMKWHEVEAYSNPDPHEREAWDFAGELLVPDAILKTLYHPEKINDLIAIFEVSKDFFWVQITRRNYI